MRQRLVKQQSLHENEDGKLYQEWLNNPKRQNQRIESLKEPIEANPDSLTEDQAMFHVDEATKETQERVRALLKLAKQILTEQQYRVFELIGLKNKTIRYTAKVLKRSPGRIGQLWEVSKVKLQNAYKTRT